MNEEVRVPVSFQREDGSSFAARDCRDVAVGDVVVRDMAGIIMRLGVTAVDERLITCAGGWQFDRLYGTETDHELGWGIEYGLVLSFLTEVERVESRPN